MTSNTPDKGDQVPSRHSLARLTCDIDHGCDGALADGGWLSILELYILRNIPGLYCDRPLHWNLP